MLLARQLITYAVLSLAAQAELPQSTQPSTAPTTAPTTLPSTAPATAPATLLEAAEMARRREAAVERDQQRQSDQLARQQAVEAARHQRQLDAQAWMDAHRDELGGIDGDIRALQQQIDEQDLALAQIARDRNDALAAVEADYLKAYQAAVDRRDPQAQAVAQRDRSLQRVQTNQQFNAAQSAVQERLSQLKRSLAQRQADRAALLRQSPDHADR